MIHAEDRKNLTKPRKKTEEKSSWSPLHFNRFSKFSMDSPQGAVAGPKGTGRANGQDYYGVDVDEGCQPETALACGTIECKA